MFFNTGMKWDKELTKIEHELYSKKIYERIGEEMSYYLHSIDGLMENKEDNREPRYNNEECKAIKRDIQKIESSSIAMQQFKNDVRDQLGLSIPNKKHHKRMYYINDFINYFSQNELDFFVKELRKYLDNIDFESIVLRRLVKSLIRSYSNKDWINNR
jgi:hypothetical protein